MDGASCVAVASDCVCSGWEVGEVAVLSPAQPAMSAPVMRTGRTAARCFLMALSLCRVEGRGCARGTQGPVPSGMAFGFLTRDCIVRARFVKGLFGGGGGEGGRQRLGLTPYGDELVCALAPLRQVFTLELRFFWGTPSTKWFDVC